MTNPGPVVTNREEAKRSKGKCLFLASGVGGLLVFAGFVNDSFSEVHDLFRPLFVLLAVLAGLFLVGAYMAYTVAEEDDAPPAKGTRWLVIVGTALLVASGVVLVVVGFSPVWSDSPSKDDCTLKWRPSSSAIICESASDARLTRAFW